ncbi:MAG: response regulator [Propioniciclava sp.]
MIRLLLVDDHPVVRAGMIAMLETVDDMEVVGHAPDGETAIAGARRLRPDVVLMDLRMPGIDGATATRTLRRLNDPPAVLVLTTYATDADIVHALEAGAQGYLLKDAPLATITDAIRRAAHGESVLAPAVATYLTRRLHQPFTPLSARELEVLNLVARGMSNADIGDHLFVSEATVKTHLARTFAKLGVSDRTAAVTAAIVSGQLEVC